MKIYTVIEATVKTSISKRTIQYKCKRDNIRKKLNVYQITDKELNKWVEEDVNSPRNRAQLRTPNKEPKNKQDEFIRGLENQLKDLKAEALFIKGKKDKRIKELEEELKNNVDILEKYEEELEELDTARVEIIRLEADVKEWEEGTLQEYLPEIEGVPLEQLEAFLFNFKRDGEDEEKRGNLLFVSEDMVSVEYTPEEYNNIKLNLENYKVLELKLDHKDELHVVETKRIEQSKQNEVEKLIIERDYYKNSYYYVRQQNKDFLSLVMLSGKESMIKTVKDAKNTDWKK